MIRNFIRSIGVEYYEDVSLKNYNTYKLDVKTKFLVFPSKKEELRSLVKFFCDNDIKFIVLGNGSNVIFSMDYYDGVVIRLDKFDELIIHDNIIEVGSGYSLIKLSMNMSLLGLSGMEFASGIPGCIGASVAMNAGAYNHSLSEVVDSVLVLNSNYEFETMKNKDLAFGYRDSFFKNNRDYIIISVKLRLDYGNREEMLEVINNRRVRRMDTQPLNYPSAGSVFRNPEGMHAGKLIEECELKGYKVGGAMVSLKHANFIVNYDNATGKDIVELINKVKREVYNKYNIELILEQIIVD